MPNGTPTIHTGLDWSACKGTKYYRPFIKLPERVGTSHELNGQVFEARLFPNPSATQFFLETELEVAEVQLYSGTGQLLSGIAYTRGEPIRLQHLPAGIYLVHARLQSGHRLLLGRIVKVD